MVAPVTGPYGRTLVFPGQANAYGFRPTWYYEAREWKRQRKPYDLPLQHNLTRKSIDGFKPSADNIGYVSTDDLGPPFTDAITAMMNKARAKLADQLGEQSLWAVNAAEWESSMKLVTQDLWTLIRFTKAVHKFDFVQAAKIVRTNVPKGLKATAKSFGSNWLKFHFGVEPLVKDIGAAIELYQNPIPPKRILAKVRLSSGKFVWTDGLKNYTYYDTTQCRTSCEVRVTNPNLFIANQLGFTNPATFVWELIPFSFVVDWFANVSQFLGQMTEFAGCEITKPQFTVMQTRKAKIVGTNLNPSYQGITADGTAVWLGRYESLPGIVLAVRPWKGVSPVRAATACALLLNLLK